MPYHAWTYDFEGKLIAAPNLTKMPDIDRDEYGLVKVHVREYLGYVWVSLADEPPSFDEDVMGAIEERLGSVHAIDGYDVANLSLGRRIRYDVKANWKLIIENFMECYHCATIHPELTEVLPEFADGLAAQYSLATALNLARTSRASPSMAQKGWTTSPVSVRTGVGVVESGKDVTASVELFHRVNQQDFDACERCQPAMGSKVYSKGCVLVPSEHHIRAFNDWRPPMRKR